MTTPIFAEKISKEEIAQMEVEEYKGRIITILTPEEAEKAVSYLMQFPALGIDTETRPCFQKGKSYIAAAKREGLEDRPLVARRLPRLAETGRGQALLLRRPAKDGRPVWHPRGQPAKDLRHPVWQEDLEATATDQLGSRCLERTAETLCGPRRLGLPPYI